MLIVWTMLPDRGRYVPGCERGRAKPVRGFGTTGGCGLRVRNRLESRKLSTFSRANRIWRKACYRLYSDLLMPNRLDLFDRLLQTAIDCGYETHSILSFWQLLEAGRRLSGKKYLILRHDVDTDAATA